MELASQASRPWYRRLSAVLLVIVCLELGLFLVVFPWSPYWDRNFFSSIISDWRWRDVWTNSYLRGAVSGLGVLNICISLGELVGLLRRTLRTE